jgi:hypothetical protein
MRINNFFFKRCVGPLVGVFFLFLAFKNFKYEEFLKALKTFNYYYVIVMLFFISCTFFLKSIRWKILIRNIKDIRIHSLISAIFIGQLINNIFPAHIGELARSYIIGIKENISKSSSFATVVMERIFDVSTLIFMLLIVSFFLPLPLWMEKILIISSISFGIVLLTLIIMIVYDASTVLNLFDKLIPNRWKNNFNKLIPLVNSFATGLFILKNITQIITVLLLSLCIWLCEATVYWVLLKAMKIGLPFFKSIFILCAGNLAAVFPSLPGNVGSFDYACILSLTFLGINESASLAYTIGIHGIEYFFQTFMGSFFLLKEGLKLRELSKLIGRIPDQPSRD